MSLQKLAVFVSVLSVVCATGNTNYNESVEIPKLGEAKKPLSVEESLKTIPPKYGVDDTIVQVLLKKESGGNMAAERLEPHKIKQASKYSKDVKDQKKWASSHCMFQVHGLEAAQRSVHWSELKTPEVCTELAMAVWLSKEQRCRKKLKSPDKYDLLKCTAKAYNGSGSRAEMYAKSFMEEYARIRINKN
jgi:hypothetical protein